MRDNAGARASHDRRNYQGKRLGLLLLAIGLPAALLYLRILLGTLSSYSRSITSVEQTRLTILSNGALACFAVVQIVCALYIQRLVPLRASTGGRILQFVAVLALCILLSITGAVLFEAFGVTMLIRTGHV